MNPSVETYHGTSLQGFGITRHLFHTWIQQRQKVSTWAKLISHFPVTELEQQAQGRVGIALIFTEQTAKFFGNAHLKDKYVI